MLIDDADLVNISDLNRNVSPWVNRAREGRRVTVMKDSVPVAQIVGIDQMRYLDLLERSAETTAAATPDPAGDPSAPALGSFTPQPGQTTIGITPAGEEISLDLNRHYLVTGADDTELTALLSAMLAAAEPNGPLEIIIGTANPAVNLVHDRRRPDIPAVVASNLEIGTAGARFAEQLVGELESRDALLRVVDVNSIADYRSARPDIAETVPDLVVVIDQADLVATHLDTTTLTTLLRRGDRYGIHLWLVTRTLNNIEHLPLPTYRLTTRLESRNLSRKILDTTDAVALGQGRAYLSGPMSTLQFALARPDHLRSPLQPEIGTTAWGPRLNAPVTLGEIDRHEHLAGELAITLGITDPPREPYVIRPPKLAANILILGQPGSGITTAITTLVASTGFAYAPSDCRFFIIDSDTKQDLEMLDALPNVGGYAAVSDVDMIERMIADLLQILEERDQLHESEFDNDVLPRHSFLVISDWRAFASSSSAEHLRKLQVLLDLGSRVGLHVVVAAHDAMQIPVKLHSHFGSTVHLKVEDVNSPGYISTRARQLAKAIPVDQPGRCVDIHNGKAARIAYPQLDSMADTGPDPDGFSTLTQALRAARPAEESATRILPVSTIVEDEDVWQAWEASAPHAVKPTWVPLWQPIGVSAETLRIATVGDHVLAVGDPRSGRTNLMRTLINNVVRQLDPSAAQFVILDSSGDLSDVRAELEQRGMLLGYAMNPQAAGQLISEKVGAVIESRVPTADTPLSREIMDNRSWYSGPDVFVIVDEATKFTVGPYGSCPSRTLSQLVELHPRLGLHVYATSLAENYSRDQHAVPLLQALTTRNAAAVYLSGRGSYGTVHAGTDIKFTERRPGHGVLLNWETMSQEVVQTSLSAPWDENGLPAFKQI